MALSLDKDSNFSASKKGWDLHDSAMGHSVVSKDSPDAEFPSNSTRDSASTWNDKLDWRPLRFKKHELKW